MLSILAKKEQKSVERFSSELLLTLLEDKEDLALSLLAQTRDTKDATYLSHEEVWNVFG